jgi:Tfp pilus assembly protein PilF
MTSKTLLLVGALVVVACGGSADNKTPAPGSDEALMASGLNKLYQGNDPLGAEPDFRAVIKNTPTHYGAHFQLAKALDLGGKPGEARPVWVEMQKLAQAINDTATLNVVYKRLAAPDTASQDAMMKLGLHLVFAKADYAAAATQFRAVLRRNPTHYGANYQLAMALERAGRKDEARPQWVKVLGMATQIRDEKTAQTAREYLR